MEQEAAGGGDADGFGDHCPRFGDVVDDAVADDDGEGRGVERQALGVGEDEIDAVGEAGGGDVCAGEREHAFGGVDGGDVHVGCAAGELDGDLGGAGAEVEDLSGGAVLV